MDAWDLFFNFRGRINRAKWWLFMVVAVTVQVIAVMAMSEMRQGPIGLITFLYFLIFAASVPVHVKRLHDRNRSGWWLLAYYGFLAVAVVARDLGPDPVVAQAAFLAILVWIVIDLGCLRGTRGPNRYGADPLQKDEALAASH